MRVRRQRERGVGQREDDAAVAGAVEVEVLRADPQLHDGEARARIRAGGAQGARTGVGLGQPHDLRPDVGISHGRGDARRAGRRAGGV